MEASCDPSGIVFLYSVADELAMKALFAPSAHVLKLVPVEFSA